MKRLLIIPCVLVGGFAGAYATTLHDDAVTTPAAPRTTTPTTPVAPQKPVQTLQERLRHKGLAYVKTVRHGHVIGYITAPRLGLHHWAIREGVEQRLLDLGPAHYPQTTLPGLGGTTAIAGHDVTPVGPLPYGPFHWLNLMRPGDKVTVTMPYGVFTYTYHRHLIINPQSGAIDTYRPSVGDRLVLSMCWPRYTALKRWVVVLWLTHESERHA